MSQALMPPKLWESGTSVIARDNTNCINFFFHSSYDDPKILDEISLDDLLFLNLAWVTDILLEQKPLSRGSCTNLVSLINWIDFSWAIFRAMKQNKNMIFPVV